MDAPPDGAKANVKYAIISGREVDLYGAARAYRTLSIAMVMGIVFLGAFALLGNLTRAPINPVFVFLLLQAVVSGMIAWGLFCSGKARGRPRVEYVFVPLVCAVVGLVPIFGLLPAVSEIGRIHRMMNTVGAPVGWFGPSIADLGKLRHGVCYHCGYDLVLLEANRCPECNADIVGQRPTEDGFVGPVRLDATEAADCIKRCHRIALVGLALYVVQWLVFFLLTPSSGTSFLQVFLPPGLVFGFAASWTALRSQRLLQEKGRVDFLMVGLWGILFPPIGSAWLSEIATRLKAAAAR